MPWKREEKYFVSLCIWRQKHSKLSKEKMQPINMIRIYYCDKKLKKRLHVLEADIITIKKKMCFNFFRSKDAFFTAYGPNDHYCASVSNKSLSY